MRDSTARYESNPACATTQQRVETILFNTIQSEFGYLALSNDCDPKQGIIPKAYSRGSQDRPTAPNAMERTVHGLSDTFILMFNHHPGPEEPWIKKMNEALLIGCLYSPAKCFQVRVMCPHINRAHKGDTNTSSLSVAFCHEQRRN